MKAKKLLAILLTICMMVSVFPAAFAADDALSFAAASKTELTPKLDGKDIKVTKYEAVYCANSNSAEQKLALFVPENATADSPIIYMVDNSGWRSDAYADVQNKVASFGTEVQELPPFMGGGTQEVEVGNYVSGSDTDAVGECLANGYVILVAGLRSRADGLTGEEYLGHSPATMVDAKAVIRYIKYNADALPAGDADKIVITGTSGGGALSVVTAGSGNSEDYYAGLYEIGAAGITKAADGSYVDTLSDDIWATIAYCPITDLGNACAAYEWQWAEAREQVIADDKVPAGGFGAPVYPEKDVRAEVTAILTANYEEYLDSLGLEAVSAKNLEATIIALIEAEIAEAVKEVGIEQMKKDLDGADWLVINDDGSFEYNYEKHLYWVGTQTAFKAPSAFSNVGMTAWAGNMNEDDLFGTRSDAYSPFNEYAWNNDNTENAVGKDDTGLTWDEYLATDAGKYLQLQTKMTSPIEYLLDAEDGDSAPYWYVRYGLADRDSSFAVEAVLNAAMEADASIKDVNFEYAWLEGHGGDYDVQEAYAWLKAKLAADAPAADTSMKTATVTKLTPKVDGKAVNVTWYADDYLTASNSAKQKVNVYIPENATEASPIMLYLNNAGWMQNDYPTNTIEDGKDYDGTNDRVGVALKEGYVVVSYGCRSRTDPVVGHSPATMTDTKAVIRYLRANDALITGDMERIVVTGTSGGGALSVIISASGNSADYYPSLYEVGAAGITKNADGSYTSTIRDDVWATIAYCPITDLGNACAAYEWTWGAARQQLMNAGALSYKGASKEEVFANSEALVALYEEYINGLGLESVSDANLKNTIIDLMKAEIDETIKEIGIEKMKEDLGGATWLKFNADGSYTYDYDAHCVWVAEQTALKIAPAFSNVGTGYGEFMNEDNLFGTAEDVYSPFNEYSWGLDKTENAVGQDDTGLTWDEYMATDAGKALALQIKMTNPIPYLLDAKEGQSAEYWYVRYGMADRDSSFAVEAVLNAAMEADASIKDKSFEFAWLEGHGGNYDVAEAYAWLKDKLGGEAETGYSDVAEGAWYADAVAFVTDAGYMNGVSATEFAPKATITRAMLATILYRMAGEPATEKAAEFKDVPAGKWYSDAIAWAAENEIVKGYGDGLFGTNEAVTREQFVTMLYRYAEFKGEVQGEGADISRFTDAKSISAWAADAVAWATEEGIIQGNPDGSFNPKGTASRAEAAVMFARF
ncbi:MAG: S-layer homology domain-containing protein [Oscillospiraceae bacterium]|nr:S-layer homology domain-containing protein [Oscillospiraceae bacterium]